MAGLTARKRPAKTPIYCSLLLLANFFSTGSLIVAFARVKWTIKSVMFSVWASASIVFYATSFPLKVLVDL